MRHLLRLVRTTTATLLATTSALAAPVAVAACASESVAPPPLPPVNWSSLQPHAVVDAGRNGPTVNERAVGEAYVAALSSPKFATLGPRLDEEARLSFPGIEDAHGRDAIMHAHDTLLGSFEPRTSALVRVFRTSSEAIVEWTLMGFQEHDFMGVAATHKPARVRGLSRLATKDDGTIADIAMYFDAAAIKAQLSVSAKDAVTTHAKSSACAEDAGVMPAPPQVLEQVGSPDEKANLAAAHDALGALEAGNEAAYEAAFAEDAQVYTLEGPRTLRGKADARAYFKAMRKTVGQLDTTVTGGFGVSNFVFIEYTIAGEMLGPLGKIPVARDRTIRLHIADVIEFTGGKIDRVWRYDNPSEILSDAAP